MVIFQMTCTLQRVVKAERLLGGLLVLFVLLLQEAASLPTSLDLTSCLSALWRLPRERGNTVYYWNDEQLTKAAEVVPIRSVYFNELLLKTKLHTEYVLPQYYAPNFRAVCTELCYQVLVETHHSISNVFTGLSDNKCYCIESIPSEWMDTSADSSNLAQPLGDSSDGVMISVNMLITECPLDLKSCGDTTPSATTSKKENCKIVPWTSTGAMCCIPSRFAVHSLPSSEKPKGLMNTFLIHSIVVIVVFCVGEVMLYFYLRSKNIWRTGPPPATASLNEMMLSEDDIAAANAVGDELVDLLPRRGQSLLESCEDGLCAICLVPLVEQSCIRLPCGHTLHADCAKSLISHGARRLQDITCPLCRVPVATLTTHVESDDHPQDLPSADGQEQSESEGVVVVVVAPVAYSSDQHVPQVPEPSSEEGAQEEIAQGTTSIESGAAHEQQPTIQGDASQEQNENQHAQDSLHDTVVEVPRD